MRKPPLNRLAPMQPDPKPQAQSPDDVNAIPPIAVDMETAARSIGICAESYRAKFNAGELPGTRIGTRIVVNLRALDDFLYAQTMQNVKTAGSQENGMDMKTGQIKNDRGSEYHLT
jgi:hypothetical protein